MKEYEQNALTSVAIWQRQILQDANYLDHQTKKWTGYINKLIPGKVHGMLTSVYKYLLRAVIFGSKITTDTKFIDGGLKSQEAAIRNKINFYAVTAATEGGITGVGGFLLGFADFPLLISIKMKMLFEIASIYGYRTGDYRERLFLIYVFLMSFSSHEKRAEIYLKIADWDNFSRGLPNDIHHLDWRTLQQEYREYTDIMKLPQWIPVIGAPFGAAINYQLTKKLGNDAMNAYRMRLLCNKDAGRQQEPA